MPGDSEHPVTVGDLSVLCEHGRPSNHSFLQTAAHPASDLPRVNLRDCDGGRPATVADLVSALRAEGVLVVEKVDGGWPEWATKETGGWWKVNLLLDVLAEAQPFPPAEEPPKDPWDYDP